MNKGDITTTDRRQQFGDWLAEQRYTRATRKTYLQAVERFQTFLSRTSGDESSAPETWIAAFIRWARPSSSSEPSHPPLSSPLKLFLRFCGHDATPKQPFSPETILLNEYERYLVDVRGQARWTIHHRRRWARLFIRFFALGDGTLPVGGIDIKRVDSFIQDHARRFKRITTRVLCTSVRAFLRFLFHTRRFPIDLSPLVIGPRVYAQEGVPFPLPDRDVETILRCVNRATKQGRRDYAILLLLARYGLRAGEVTRLRLDDIDWRHGHLRIRQRKAGTPYQLPLLSDVARALVSYLKHGRPDVPFREIFIRVHAPFRPFSDGGSLTHLCRDAIDRAKLKRSQYKGSHAFRHSLATRLVRLGQPLKTVGDVLGHRSHQSALVYAKLNLRDLRQVCLEVPR